MFELNTFDKKFNSSEWQDVARAICAENNIAFGRLERAGGTDHVVFFVGDDLILKIYRPSRNSFIKELNALRQISDRSKFKTPTIICDGKFDGFDFLVMTRVNGDELSRPNFYKLKRSVQIAILSDISFGLKQLHDIPIENGSNWQQFVENNLETFIERQIVAGVNSRIISQLPKYIEESFGLIPFDPTVFLHGDIHLGNLRFDHSNGFPVVSGLFDLADSLVGWHEYDLLAICVLIIQGERELQREFLRAYGYRDKELNDEMRRRLMMLTMLYETSDLRRYAQRLRPDAVTLDLYELEKEIWSFV